MARHLTKLLPGLLASLVACSPPAPAAPAPPPAEKLPTPATARPVAACPALAPELAEDEEVEGKLLDLPIERVCVHGASEETRPTVDRELPLRVAQPLTPEAIRAALERLAGTGLFEDIRLGAEAHENAAIVHVVLRERLQIEEVVYEPAAAQSALGPVDLGKRADPHALRAMAERAEGDLQQKGYGNARVAMTLEPTREGFARVHVKIDRGPAWTISKLSFPGAKKVPGSELQSASGLASGSAWSADAIRAVNLKLSSLYLDRGFVTAKIDEPEQSVDATGNVTLSWKIEEGAAYTLGKITLQGEPAGKVQSELRALMKSRPRAPFNRTQLAADAEQIRGFFARRSKAVEVVPLVELNQKARTINVVLDIRESSGNP